MRHFLAENRRLSPYTSEPFKPGTLWPNSTAYEEGNKRTFLLFALALLSAVLFTACQTTTTRTDATLRRLQGYWEGEGAGGKCSITITGTSLLYRAGTNWFKTTFTLPEGTDPRQLHATVTDCSPPTNNSIGIVVSAIFKLEDGILTLAEVDASDKPPESFASASSRYIVKKAQPARENAEPPKSK